VTLIYSDIAEDPCPTIKKPSSSNINEGPVPLRELFVPRILIPVSNYCFLAFLGIACAALLPLFYSTPIKFGGLGLSPPIVGLCLGGFGLVNGFFQAFFFTKFVGLWGPKRIFLIGMAGYLPIFATFPVIHVFASWWGLSPLIWALVAFQLFMMVIVDMSYGENFPLHLFVYHSNCLMATGCIFMFIMKSAPNKRSLGATNGLSQTTVSIARAVGPAISTSLFAFSSEHNLLGGYAVYAFFFALSGLSLLFATRLPNDPYSEEDDE
jgi:MFS family permease